MRGGGGMGGNRRGGGADAKEVRAELGLSSAGSATFSEMIAIMHPYFWPSAFHERVAAVSCFLLLGLSKVANITAPIFLGLATDALFRGVFPWSHILTFGALRFAVSLFEEAQRLVYLRVKEVAYREIATRTFAHLLRLSHSWHVSKKLGVVLRASDRGVNSASTIVEMLFLRLVPTVLEMCVTAVLFGTAYGSPGAAGVLVAAFACYFVATWLLTRVRTKLRVQQNVADNDSAQVAADVLGCFEAVATWSAEERELSRYEGVVRTQQKLSRQSQAALVALNLTQQFIMRAALVGVLLASAHDVVGGRASVGDFVALSAWVVQLFAPLNFLGTLYQIITQAASDMRNLADLLKERASVADAPNARPLTLRSDGAVPRIEFRDVHFSYTEGELNLVDRNMEVVRASAAHGGSADSPSRLGAAQAAIARWLGYAQLDERGRGGASGAVPGGIEEWGGGGVGPSSGRAPRDADAIAVEMGPREILRGVSFFVRAGSTVGVVGTTGSGKSTLARLVLRFADPTSGAVLIDGTPLQSVTQASVRGLAVGYVGQDISLFNDTLGWNIAYARPSATTAEIVAAAAAAQLTDMIARLPLGLDTRVGERGLKLSGGEKQRVALARALLVDPPILVLDEATSALDSSTEASVARAIAGRSGSRTTLIIAHRLSTIADADEIIVLENGLIIERGTHAELLSLEGGRFSALWHRQIADGVVPGEGH